MNILSSKTFKYLSRAGIALILFVILGMPAAHAQGPIGITVTPAKYIIEEMDPGESEKRSITVINPNDFTLKVRPEFQDFKVTEQNDVQWIPNDVENPYKLSQWIEINQDVITLPPRGEATIPFAINIPNNATAGGRYAAIFFTAVLDETGGNVGSVPRVGALVIANIAGDIKKTGELISFDTPLFTTSGPIDLKATFLNTGTTHFEAEGDITLTSIFGQKTFLTTGSTVVYPDIDRELTAVWEDESPLGIYFAKLTITDGTGETFTDSNIIIALPIKLLVGIIIVIAFILFVWRFIKKRFKFVRVK